MGTKPRWLQMLRPVRRPPEALHVPYVEFYLGRLCGAVLVWLGKRALKRRDLHEFNHCSASIASGNSAGDHIDCPLNIPVPLSPADALLTLTQGGSNV